MPADTLQTCTAWQHATCCCWPLLLLLVLLLLLLLQLRQKTLRAGVLTRLPGLACAWHVHADRLGLLLLLLQVLAL
jgi:hypothetical protein